MLTLFLPGFSGQYNGPEMEEISRTLRQHGLEVQEFEWPHWANPDHEFKADVEAERVWEFIQKSEDQEIAIVAKSIGTYVAMLLIDKHPEFVPKKVVLLGVPKSSLPEADLAVYPKVVASLGGKVKIIQNESDPFGSAAEVNVFLESSGAEIEIIEGNDTHGYNSAKEMVADTLLAA